MPDNTAAIVGQPKKKLTLEEEGHAKRFTPALEPFTSGAIARLAALGETTPERVSREPAAPPPQADARRNEVRDIVVPWERVIQKRPRVQVTPSLGEILDPPQADARWNDAHDIVVPWELPPEQLIRVLNNVLEGNTAGPQEEALLKALKAARAVDTAEDAG